MSRVNWDTAGWLARESFVSLPAASSGGTLKPNSFDRHLEQAERMAVPSSGTPSAPLPSSAPSRPPDSPPQDHSQQSPRDDRPGTSRSESDKIDSRPTPATEDHSQSSSPQASRNDAEQSGSVPAKPQSADGRRDSEKDQNGASDAASAAAGAATSPAQASQDRAQQTTPPGHNAKSAELAEHTHGHGKPAARPGAKKQTKANEEPAPSSSADGDQHSKPEDAVPAVAKGETEGAAALAGQDSAVEGSNVQPAAAAATPDPSSAAAAIAVEPGSQATGGKASAVSRAATAAAEKPIEAAAQTAPSSAQERAAAGPSSAGATRRTNSRPTAAARAPGEVQSPTEPSPAATADGDALPETPSTLASAPDSADLAATKSEPKAAGNQPADPAQESKAADPVSTRDAKPQTADAAGSRNEEASKTDTAERARFVQRVAKAFESAAERAGHVRLRLHPAELGSLRLDLTIRDGHMTARLQTETESARNMLMENLPALKERLSEHQIKVESFEIEWQGQPQGGFSQHTADQSRWQPPPTGYAMRNSGNGQASSDTQAVGVAARRVSPGTSIDVVI